MQTQAIKPVVMPKWGLSMAEGRITGWLKQPGSTISTGDDLLEVETDKITNVVEAGDAGVLRRVLGEPGNVYPVKALIAVLADAEVTEADIDAFIAAYSAAAEAAEEDGAGAAPDYEFADTACGRLRFARRGEHGPTLVLIHGFGGDLDNWLFNIDALAEKARVHALDLPGHGQSTKALPEPTVAGLSRALLAFMDSQQIETAHLAGHSLGGAVAMRTALDAPQRVASVALIASAGLGAEINRAYIDGFVGAVSRRELKPVLADLFADPNLVSRQLVDDLLKYKRLDGVEQALRALASGVFPQGSQGTLLGPAFAQTGLPALVLWGEQDRVIPAAHATALGPAARTEVIPNAGHMVQMEAAAKVNALLAEQLSRP